MSLRVGPSAWSASPLGRNRLLAAVPPRDLKLLRPRFAWVPLARGQVLAERGSSFDHAYFIERGTVSLLSDPVSGAVGLQLAMIGSEGMVGGLPLLGLSHDGLARAVVQTPGGALRIDLRTLRHAAQGCPALHDACLRSVRSLLDQIAQTAACNARRSVLERCARWLAMAHDRVEGTELRVTHEALAAMLGVRRAGITVAVAALQAAGLVRVGRGRIAVLDRAGLEGIARGEGHPLARVPRARPDRQRPNAHPLADGAVV